MIIITVVNEQLLQIIFDLIPISMGLDVFVSDYKEPLFKF